MYYIPNSALVASVEIFLLYIASNDKLPMAYLNKLVSAVWFDCIWFISILELLACTPRAHGIQNWKALDSEEPMIVSSTSAKCMCL